MKLFNFNQWNNPTDYERNELVFEKRNKAYGAYFIRTNYNRTLIRALVCTVFFIMGLFMIPKVTQLFAKEPIPIVEYAPIPFIDPPIEIPLEEKKLVKSTKNDVKTKAEKYEKITDDELKIDTTKVDTMPVKFADKDNPNGKDSSELPYYDGDLDSGNTIIVAKVEKKEIKKEDTPIVLPIMPEFIGGEKALFEYLSYNTEFPDKAKNHGKSARVRVGFVIEKDGSISNIRILSCDEKDYGFEAEAIRVMEGMPKWKPGMQSPGHPARVMFNIPFDFRLN